MMKNISFFVALGYLKKNWLDFKFAMFMTVLNLKNLRSVFEFVPLMMKINTKFKINLEIYLNSPKNRFFSKFQYKSRFCSTNYFKIIERNRNDINKKE